MRIDEIKDSYRVRGCSLQKHAQRYVDLLPSC